MIKPEDLTDEMIRGLQQSVAGRAFPAAGMAHTEAAEIWETCNLALYGGTWSPPSPRQDARARCAEILSARMAKCDDHWHCDEKAAAHICTKPDRSQPCPSCGAVKEPR